MLRLLLFEIFFYCVALMSPLVDAHGEAQNVIVRGWMNFAGIYSE